MTGQSIPQLLSVLKGVHQFFHPVAFTTNGFQLTLDVLQALIDDVHTEVEYEMLDALAQATAAALQFKAATKLVVVNGQPCSQLAHGGVRMLHEILVGLEPRVAGMLHGLMQDAVVA